MNCLQKKRNIQFDEELNEELKLYFEVIVIHYLRDKVTCYVDHVQFKWGPLEKSDWATYKILQSVKAEYYVPMDYINYYSFAEKLRLLQEQYGETDIQIFPKPMLEKFIEQFVGYLTFYNTKMANHEFNDLQKKQFVEFMVTMQLVKLHLKEYWPMFRKEMLAMPVKEFRALRIMDGVFSSRKVWLAHFFFAIDYYMNPQVFHNETYYRTWFRGVPVNFRHDYVPLMALFIQELPKLDAELRLHYSEEEINIFPNFLEFYTRLYRGGGSIPLKILLNVL